MLAANQHGEHAQGIRSGGRSMIVDPWGTALAQAPDVDEAVVVADLDLDRVDEVREGLPVLRQRRGDVAAALAAEVPGDLTAGWDVAAPDEPVRDGGAV